MKPLLFKIVLLFALASSIIANAKSVQKPLVLSCEVYTEGQKHFTNQLYLSMNFDLIPANSRGDRFTAKLRASVYNENFIDQSEYYELGDPFADHVYQNALAFNFLREHPIQLQLKDNEVRIVNGDSLKTAFLAEKKKYSGRLWRSSGESTDGFFSKVRLSDIFQQMIIQMPEDIKNPGDMSLWNRDVYNYVREKDSLQHFEITRLLQHQKLQVYKRQGSRFVKYNQVNAGNYRMIIRVIEKGVPANFRLSGEFVRNKNAEVGFTVEPLDPLLASEKVQIKTNASGRFAFNLNLEAPVMIRSDNGFLFYAEPGDELSFTSGQKQDSLFFTGIGAGNNDFLQAESRIEKLELSRRMGSRAEERTFFKNVNRIMSPYFETIDLYKNDLSPRFYELRYCDYYFGKINKKLEYSFSWFEFNDKGIYHRQYTGLDTIPENYQSFVYDREYNKYLYNKLIIYSEKLRNFTFAYNYDSHECPQEKEYIQLASFAYSGKMLRDYLSFSAKRLQEFNDIAALDVLESVIAEKFDNSALQTGVANLRDKFKQIRIGEQFPAIVFRDEEGKEITLDHFKGKIVYLMFWRNDAFVFDLQWENYLNLYKATESDQVVFVNVGMEADFPKWKLYVEGAKFPGVSLFLNKKSDDALKYLQNIKTRHYILIDRSGTIVNNNGPDPAVANLLISENIGTKKREKTYLYIGIALFVIVLLGSSIWLIDRSRAKRKARIDSLMNQLRETELKAIKAQMNPHFLFNSLNSIQNLINQQSIGEANMYLSRFARLLRSVLQHSEKEFVPLADELETIKLYGQLEKLRFNFEFDLQVAPELDIYNTLIPPLLLQPFMENAILHGLQPKKGAKKLEVIIQTEGEQIHCLIRDNGVGRGDHSIAPKEGHQGMGNKLSLERINLLNQKNNCNFTLQINDIAEGGTEVSICYTNNLI